jgi:hypothetical protein
MLSVLILEYIMGWDICVSLTRSMFNEKHIMIYSHASFYEHLIGYLLSLRYQTPLIFLAENDMNDDLITEKFLRTAMDLIYVDRKKDDVVSHVIESLAPHSDGYIFAILMEGSGSDTVSKSGLKNTNVPLQILHDNSLKKHQMFQGFYQIAMRTNSQIHQAIFDFENQVMRIENIDNSDYDQMIEKLTYGFKNEIPYHDKMKSTSMINVNRSVLIYFPPMFIFFVLSQIFLF